MICPSDHLGRCRPAVLDLFFAVSDALSKSLDLRHVLGFALKAMAEHMGMMRGTITIVNRETDKIQIEEAYGLSRSQQARGRYRLGEGITGKVVETGQTMVVPKISENPLFLDKTCSRKGMEKKDISFICVPVKLGNEVIGTLSADKVFENSNSLEEDEQILKVIAALIANAVQLRQEAGEQMQQLEEENLRLHNELKQKFKPENIIGKSAAMRTVYSMISKVLQSNTTVLIRGESGVGKELVAQAIHYNGLRSHGPFIKVNCSAIPDNLIESELFGHEKGAFTGAVQSRKGRFESANGGTIFLDEVGDIPLSTQVKLLRVLQEKEIERLGSNKPVPVDVRVITATNRDLEELVAQKKFREDFYYRINVFPIFVPPLKERHSDIILLANHFVEKYSKQNKIVIKSISNSFMNALLNYSWPGNVRELENCIERAVLLCNDGVLRSIYLPPQIRKEEGDEEVHENKLQYHLDKLEKEMICEALEDAKGNMSKAASALGITERIMGLRIKKHEIDASEYKRRGK